MAANNGPVLDSREFRRVMGLFATGVSVIAVQVNGEVHGMTANAVMSVSLEPMLVCVCVNRRARMQQLLQDSTHFSINILQERQEPLSQFFAGMWKDPTPPEFRFEPWQDSARLVGSLASIACRVHEVLEGGDHRMVLGRMLAHCRGEEPLQPLLYFGGKYHRVRTPAVEAAQALVGEL